ncbi:MAG: CoB--CoM heterodisulfide reductase iron-sulfur subunit A family protein [Deltaproteobacteria bacterium]|nr:CoB--CoM heterodisulfide reductase iron-sulfur subunit A family protein [Deltaproteobacteria bacterium]
MAWIRPLERVVSPRVLVVGGGIAGMQAALDVAKVGLPVTLVEQGPSIGGLMAQLDKTFPTNDCAMCILSPRMLEIARHPLIEILTLTQVVQIQGRPGDFQVVLCRRPRFVDLSKCSGCGECTRVCPRRIPDPYNLGLNQTKAIHVPFPQAVPLAAYIIPEACRYFEGKKCEACIKVCQAGAIDLHQTPEILVQQFGAVILATGVGVAPADNFPGYENPDVVTSQEFERLLSATGPHAGKLLRPSDQTPPGRIAFIQCVGSRDPREGVAHCSAVCCMASLKEALVAKEISATEVQATIFYMDIRTHGKGFERYLQQAQDHGVQLIRSRVTAVGPRPQGGVVIRYTDPGGRPDEDSFDLAVLAVGLRPTASSRQWVRRLGMGLNESGFIKTSLLVPTTTEREGVFICGTASGPMDIPEAVTSASASAAAASQLLTLGVRTRPAKAKLPGPRRVADYPPRIGVFLCHCGTNIAKVIDIGKLATAVEKLPAVVHVEDNLFTCSVDSTKRMSETIRDLGLNRVVVAACTPRTHEVVFREVLAEAGLNPGYFAFANIREQCSWVHQDDQAAALHKAEHVVAMAVGRAWMLTPIQPQGFPVNPKALVLGGGVAGMSAALTLGDQGFHTYLLERSRDLGGIARQLHFTLEGADPQKFLQELKAEVYRHPNVEVLTQTEAVQVNGHVGQFQTLVRQQTAAGPLKRWLDHGVTIVATGGRVFNPQGRYLYGTDPRILTQLELEARIKANDPQLEKVRQVVMIQCVGSREPEHPYCSRICCSEALKNALLLKERYPLTEVMILYRDLRAYGLQEIYYQDAKQQGVEFIPFDPKRPPQLEITKRRQLKLLIRDELLDQELSLSADLVILSVGIEPAVGSDQVARLLGLSQTLEGFFLEAHQKLRPVDVISEGIFLCGLAHYPKTLGETVAQAQAAAIRAASILFQTELLSGEMAASITTGKCRRCLHCLEVCPFKAVGLEANGKPTIQTEVCQGCGICASECPAEAIQMSRISDAELEAQIDAALMA